MECHPDKMHVDFLLKSISDLILQEFKAMRQDMKIEFAQLQINMEDIVSKILAETKKAEIINRAIPIEKTSQALDVASDIGICIKEVYSQNASVFPLVEAVKEEPLLLQHWEVSEKDDPSMSMSNKFSHQSEVEVNAVVKTVDPQTCIEEDHSEKALVYPQFEVIEEEPLLLQKYELSQTEIDDPNISMLNKFLPQSDIAVNSTIKIVKPQSCVARNSDEECSDSMQMFLNKSTAMEIINACKDDAQLLVGNNEENKCKRNLKRPLDVLFVLSLAGALAVLPAHVYLSTVSSFTDPFSFCTACAQDIRSIKDLNLVTATQQRTSATFAIYSGDPDVIPEEMSYLQPMQGLVIEPLTASHRRPIVWLMILCLTPNARVAEKQHAKQCTTRGRSFKRPARCSNTPW
ncbi:unnamed protein product [Clavelina lepadiformis]|uniref:Uncharacterized protein n=1 Tax=Clavelina lepadiformis TaxID=159417 RepID=A0ABP0GN69_CLALP